MKANVSRLCSYVGCSRPLTTKGLCDTHYARMRRNGHTLSTSPIALENRHGHSKLVSGKQHLSPEYRSWRAMNKRLFDKKCKDYKYYGGRGIKRDAQWSDFRNFLVDMGPRPAGKTLNRVDNDGDYCKSNCEWATVKKQNRNRSHTKLTEERVGYIRELLGLRVPISRLALMYDVSKTIISEIKIGRKWA